MTTHQLDSELLKQIRQIQIRSARIVNEGMAGEYKSLFKGQGMEFEEVRAYVPGDDVRSIDWNVTARTGEPYIKRFVEERELTVMLVIDMSASGAFGSGTKTKNRIAAEIGALLAFSAITNNDRVGLIIFTDQVEKYVPPEKGKKHVLRIIREILTFRPTHQATDIAAGLNHLNKILSRHGVVFLLSDFIASINDFRRALLISGKRHNLTAISLRDPREAELPAVGLIHLRDAETGEHQWIDTDNRNVRDTFKKHAHRRHQELLKMLRQTGTNFIDINTARSFVDPLIKHFKQRKRR